MVTLATQIENYIKRLLELSDNNCVELQRSNLAEIFMCVPSQINYVLSTRFSREMGYLIETRRGGGGYVKIVKLDFDNDADLAELLQETKSKPLNEAAAQSLVRRLSEEELLTPRESALFTALMRDDSFPGVADMDNIRGQMMRILLLTLLREDLT